MTLMTTDCQSHQVGFKTNWDLSGTFMPYDGLFYPYQEEWLNLGPINEGLDQYNVTYAMINQYYQKYKSLGFHSLSYFDIGNWGTMADANYSGPAQYCGTRPNGLPAPCPTPGEAPLSTFSGPPFPCLLLPALLLPALLQPALWPADGSNAFLRDQLKPALVQHFWNPFGGRVDQFIQDWVGTTWTSWSPSDDH